ncbi:MAG: gephyrin-like molybdotransferase Glp [Alphaproteobacteria bacterium]
MTQLSDDCFAFGGELKRADEALAMLEARLSPVVGRETIALGQALGRITAADIVAPRDVPPYDNAAVDGYAVAFEDLTPGSETRLEVAGRIAAGHPLPEPPRRGNAYRIFTGAPMPKDASGNGPDTVLMQEDCAAEDGAVRIPAGIKRGANRRKRGEDVRAGETVLPRGHRIRPQDVGLAASLGLTEIVAYERLRVAVFSTGDEVREPGQPIPEGCIYDSNRYGLMALLTALKCRVTDLGILPDHKDAIRDALAAAAQCHDLLLTSGGVSTGEEDRVRQAVEELGEIHMWRLAIRPGRPIAFGRVRSRGHEAAFIGLPGNPVAVMVTFLRFARPAILRLSGCAQVTPLTFKVAADFAYKKRRPRLEWIRARLVHNGSGMPAARPHPKEGAGILTSMVESDGLVEIPEDVMELKPGDPVTFLPFSEVLA